MVLRLEVFETSVRKSSSTVTVEADALEEERLEAFDKGYAAGWDDATASQADDQARIRSDLARHLQSLSFTHAEARAHVLSALKPLLLEIVTRLLPETARATLAPLVLEAVMPLAETMADQPIVLVLNPAVRPAVESLVGQATGLPLDLKEEPSLGEGQVYIRLGTEEVLVDLDRAITDIAKAVHGFFDLAEKEIQHG